MGIIMAGQLKVFLSSILQQGQKKKNLVCLSLVTNDLSEGEIAQRKHLLLE